MLVNLTKPQAKKLAREAITIVREEHDERLIEKPVTYEEMIEELSHYGWWAQYDEVKNQILISCRAHFSLTITLGAR